MKHDLNLKMIKSNFDHFVNMALSSYRKSTSKSFTRSNDIIYLNDDYFIISANTADELSEKPIISTKNNKFHLFYNDDKILENLFKTKKIKITTIIYENDKVINQDNDVKYVNDEKVIIENSYFYHHTTSIHYRYKMTNLNAIDGIYFNEEIFINNICDELRLKVNDYEYSLTCNNSRLVFMSDVSETHDTKISISNNLYIDTTKCDIESFEKDRLDFYLNIIKKYENTFNNIQLSLDQFLDIKNNYYCHNSDLYSYDNDNNFIIATMDYLLYHKMIK